jgi:hypothetical protein
LNWTNPTDVVANVFAGGAVVGAIQWIIDKGDSNHAPTQTGKDLVFWVAPIPVLLPQWQGTLTGSNAADNQFSAFAAGSAGIGDSADLQFRMIDIGDNTGGDSLQSGSDTGSICVTNIKVESIDASELLNEPGTLAGFALGSSGPIAAADLAAGSTITRGANSITLDLPSLDSEIGFVRVQYDDPAVSGPSSPDDFASGSTDEKFYPVTITAGTTYILAAQMENSASGTVDGETLDPIDAVTLNWRTLLQSQGSVGFVTVAGGTSGALASAGAPRGSEVANQTYLGFINGLETGPEVPGVAGLTTDDLAFQLDFFNTPAFVPGGSGADDTTINQIDVFGIIAP